MWCEHEDTSKFFPWISRNHNFHSRQFLEISLERSKFSEHFVRQTWNFISIDKETDKGTPNIQNLIKALTGGNRTEGFCKKGVVKKFVKFTGKRLYWSLFSISCWSQGL